jgi:hypothetical protein
MASFLQHCAEHLGSMSGEILPSYVTVLQRGQLTGIMNLFTGSILFIYLGGSHMENTWYDTQTTAERILLGSLSCCTRTEKVP